MSSTDQNETMEYWKSHGWDVDKHIENSPQVVMKRIGSWVDDVSAGAYAPWKNAPGL